MSRVDHIAERVFNGKELPDLATSPARPPHDPKHSRLLTPQELSEISGVSKKDIYHLRRLKRLRGWRVPGRTFVKFTLEDLWSALERV